MSDPPNAILPDVLETLLQAEADFGRLLREAAPLPKGNPKDDRHGQLMARYDRYIPSAEVIAIVRLYYMLDAYDKINEAAIRRVIAAHNERMAQLAGDANYLTRMHVLKSKLLEARFTPGAAEHVAVNFAYHRQVALDATAIGRLLVEFANKNQLAEAMELLALLGLFKIAPSAYNAKIYLSVGRLETLYRGFLAQVWRGVRAASGDSGGDNG